MTRYSTDGVRVKKCPLCGGEIEISFLFQYSHTYKLTKSGRISKRYAHKDNGSMEVAVAGCRCGANWGEDDFDIDENGYFVDYKYGREK